MKNFQHKMKKKDFEILKTLNIEHIVGCFQEPLQWGPLFCTI